MRNKKNELRQRIIELRNSMNETEKESIDNKIFEEVVQLPEYINARIIFVYVSYKSEVDTHRIIKEALLEGKVVCVPKIISRKEGMKALKIDNFEDLKVGSYGILEPDNKNMEINPADIDLVLAPGVAFDLNGARMGYGAGFYDRFLKHIRTSVKKIALAYECQIVECVPTEEYDIPIDRIITGINTHNIK